MSADFLRSHVKEIAAAIFYLTGPPGLVAGITKAVSEAGVDPAHVRSEEFAGY